MWPLLYPGNIPVRKGQDALGAYHSPVRHWPTPISHKCFASRAHNLELYLCQPLLEGSAPSIRRLPVRKCIPQQIFGLVHAMFVWRQNKYKIK